MARLLTPHALLLTALVVLLLPVDLAADEDTALFWALQRKGEPVGYLLGTIHSEDPRVLDFPDEFMRQLSGSEVFAMEMVPDLPTLARLTEYMQYQDGTTLESRIGPERYARLGLALERYRIPQDWLTRMKVWAAMMTLSVPPPETGLFMDFSLSLRAAGAGLQVVGLETLEQQLSFLENMPLEQQIILLDEALEEFEQVAESHRKMVDSYLQGDVRELERMVTEQLDRLEPAARDYFMKEGIEVRNHRMLEAVLEQLAQSRVFIAIGALHLPGDNGLIELLRRSGYEMVPLPLPLPSEPNQAE
ncbi:MAG: TraB/GumN family protein [Xanthomonadales bacterium]|nr:TraB/GumN family protein [Xanthomonadales bacterium]